MSTKKDPRFNKPVRQPLTPEHALAIALAGVWIGITADDQAVRRVREVIAELNAMGFVENTNGVVEDGWLP